MIAANPTSWGWHRSGAEGMGNLPLCVETVGLIHVHTHCIVYILNCIDNIHVYQYVWWHKEVDVKHDLSWFIFMIHFSDYCLLVWWSKAGANMLNMFWNAFRMSRVSRDIIASAILAFTAEGFVKMEPWECWNLWTPYKCTNSCRT